MRKFVVSDRAWLCFIALCWAIVLLYADQKGATVSHRPSIVDQSMPY